MYQCCITFTITDWDVGVRKILTDFLDAAEANDAALKTTFQAIRPKLAKPLGNCLFMLLYA